MAPSRARRLVRVALALLLLSSAGFEGYSHAAYLWVALGLLGPDLALLRRRRLGVASGRLAPRAVPLYNALHAYWGPVGLMALALPDPMPRALFIIGLAWAAHVALDRALGFGLRDADGLQRGR